MTVKQCCTDRELSDFDLGELRGDEYEQIARHLEECPSCATRFENLPEQADPVREHLRLSLPEEILVDDPELKQLSERAAALLDTGRPASAETSLIAAARPQDLQDAIAGMLSPPESEDELGRLGGYRVQEVLGVGGMGIVFRAEDPVLHRTVALKVMKPAIASDAAARERFLREARGMAAVEHDHIVTIHQVGEERDVPFLAMPLLKGESLSARLQREGRLESGEALRITAEAARGLAAAHTQGLVHRDIKPDNIWLEEGTGRVKILDFGLARAVDAPSEVTQSGQVLGTASYLSPEQASGETVDARSDLFSLGVTLYQMLTGRRPFDRPSLIATLKAIGADEPQRLDEADSETPPGVLPLVGRLLEKNPESRFQTAEEVVQAIEDVRSTDERPRVASAAGVVPPRKRLLVAASGLLAAVLLAGIFVIVRDKDGNPIARLFFPDGASADVSREGEEAQPAPVVPHPAVVSTDPDYEHRPWLPEGLVAVIGDERGRHWGRRDGVGGSAINGFEVSPDGATLATGDQHGVHLWEIATLQEQAFVPTPTGPVAYSPDGRLLATGSGNRLVVYEVSGAELRPIVDREIYPAETTVFSVAFYDDGKRLITASHNEFRLWDMTGDEPRLANSIGHLGAGAPVAVSPDGRTLASMSAEDTIQLWDIAGEALRETVLLEGHEAPVTSLMFAPDGKTLASGSRDDTVRIWDLNGAELHKLRPFEHAGGQNHSVSFSPDGRYLAASLDGGDRLQVCLFDRDDPTYSIKTFIEARQGQLEFSPDGKTLLVGQQSGLVRLFDVSGQPRELHEPSSLLPGPGSVAYCRDGKTLATVGPDRKVHLWDVSERLPTLETVLSEELPSSVSPRLRCSPDGRWLVGGGDVVWDLSGDQPRSVAMPSYHRFAFAAVDGELATLGDGQLRVWDMSGDEPVEQFAQELPEGTDLLAFSPDGDLLVSAVEGSKQATIWRVAESAIEQGATLETRPLRDLSFTTDGRLITPKHYGPTGADVWDVRGSEARLLDELPTSYTLSVTPIDEDRFLTSEETGRVTEWRDGQPQREWQLPGTVHDLSVSPDGGYLATANGNGTVYILRLDGNP